MPGFKEAPRFGEKIHDGDIGYKIVKINYVKSEKTEKKEEDKRKPKPLLEQWGNK